MKKTFLRRLTSIIVALSMISISVSTGTFAVETGPDTAEAAGTSAVNGIEADFESEGNYSRSENNGDDGTDEPFETSASAETSVTELPAEAEATTATGETPAETTASEGEISDETDTATETSVADETEETEQDGIDLLSLEDNVIISGADLALLENEGEYSLGQSINDPSSSLTVNESESITIDLGGYDLSIGTITIGESAALTIKGTGTISNTNIVSNKGQLIADGSNLTINGGSIQINEFKDYDTVI